ncbi:MAG TPA: hypothetical protein PKY59_21760 [Pyrinomonadaceae bacterium]|nr:hypothetical protein [Pyrinomonadaceae bacterium]
MILYELPSALADGTDVEFTALAELQTKKVLFLSALAKAERMIGNLFNFGSSR